MRNPKNLGALLLALALSAPISAHAISDLYVFGDSLSDVGNLSQLFGGTQPGDPYDNGYFSNGPVWVQTLGTLLGVGPTTNSLSEGNNYAWGGARTSVVANGFIPSLQSQSTTYLSDVGGIADSNGLYVVWGGGNDIRSDDAATANTATDISMVITDLINAGATNFLIPNLPDIGLTPEALAGITDSATMTALTLAHNTALALAIDSLSLANPDVNIQLFDVFSIFNMLIGDPASFGFTETQLACFDGVNVCADPDSSIFWDGIHPTAAAHALLGQMAAAQVVPVPAALPLLLSGLGFLGFLGRRRRA